MTITSLPHYKLYPISSVHDVREIFPDGKADLMNWFFLSTSGVHGSYATLDDLYTGDYGGSITMLVVQPRLVVVRYGEVEVEKDDIPFLRGLVTSTIQAVAQSQEGNTL
jgi:hypothetical protein